ncbi:MAG: type II secretion system protein [Planctomycetes bacterium]|nr:type II secretion system protein [Planctomycetota bacterium]
MNSHSTRRGFTLIELLVVIAIITLLISIIVPSLSQARRQAKNTKCLAQLRDLIQATHMYINEQRRLPPLNNDFEEGAWQYNYLIFDGRDYDQCFGPLGQPDGPIKYTQELFCPVQENPFHMFNTRENPWPVVPNADTRAGYARRYGLTGLTLTEFRTPKAVMADLIHVPDVITQTGHVSGVNAVFSDGHGKRISSRKHIADNDLATPFDPMDNPIVADIWDEIEEFGN